MPGASPLLEFLWLQSAWWLEGRRIPSGKPDYSSTEDPQTIQPLDISNLSSCRSYYYKYMIHWFCHEIITMCLFIIALQSSHKIREHQCFMYPLPSQFSDTKEMAHNRKEGREKKKQAINEEKTSFLSLLKTVEVTHWENSETEDADKYPASHGLIVEEAEALQTNEILEFRERISWKEGWILAWGSSGYSLHSSH